ncbi:MAG: HAMP domain-containing protein [Phycisphaerales bacterium]|nr:HAMP domain-containing protein [Phycisphaerales bacterium]
MRFAQVSLAAKYRVLFGLAVVAILASALSVPWYRMEALLLDQPYQEARRAVDEYFRLTLPQGSTGSAVGSVHGKQFGLVQDLLRHQPKYTAVGSAEIAPPDQPGSALDQFSNESLAFFRRHPKRDFTHKLVRGDDGRTMFYANAVRATKSCLDCHDEGKSAPAYRENELVGVLSVGVRADASLADLVINRAWLIASGVLAGILAILVFYLIVNRFILSPIHELKSVAIAVAEGDVDIQSNVRTGDEFEQFSDSLNTMLGRLRESERELRRANNLLDQKLGQMAESNVALFEANRLKNEFLANISHELRTPLTSIIGFAELIHESPQAESNPKTARYTENILISGRILLEMINDLLDLAKIEAGRMTVNLTDVDVTDLCEALLEFVRREADKRELRLELDTADDVPVIHTDRARVRQVLMNLLSNAIKFTPEGGLIRMVLRRAGDERVRIEVTDTGPGIALADQKLIFEKFRQVDQSKTRPHQGSGLGLAIAREFTLLLGGEIGVSSEPGHGATFWVELPLSISAAVERPLISLA